MVSDESDLLSADKDRVERGWETGYDTAPCIVLPRAKSVGFPAHEARAVLIEPIPVGHRIRDVVELRDGTIAMKTDSGRVIFMRPAPTSPPLGDTGDRTDSETTATDAVSDVWTLERGELLSLSCLGCHTMGKREPSGIGSNSRDVYGREIGRYPGYLFSKALRAKTGHWDAAALAA